MRDIINKMSTKIEEQGLELEKVVKDMASIAEATLVLVDVLDNFDNRLKRLEEQSDKDILGELPEVQ
jgi:coenzyme F420-reducing hydrogenase delta subunit